jgi:hypothetical protein
LSLSYFVLDFYFWEHDELNKPLIYIASNLFFV